jgi:hypothetical protein
MLEYRVYLIGRDGHFKGVEPIVCTDDDEAIAAAKRLVIEGCNVELWQRDRKVTTLSPESD